MPGLVVFAVSLNMRDLGVWSVVIARSPVIGAARNADYAAKMASIASTKHASIGLD